MSATTIDTLAAQVAAHEARLEALAIRQRDVVEVLAALLGWELETHPDHRERIGTLLDHLGTMRQP